MFRDWVHSSEGLDEFVRRLSSLRAPISGTNLLLNLASLYWFQNAHLTTSRDELFKSPLRDHVTFDLVAFDKWVNGKLFIGSPEGHAILQEAIWSLSRASSRPFGLDFGVAQQILGPVLECLSVSRSSNRFTDQYFLIRLGSPRSHLDALAQVRHDMEHAVPKETRIA